MGEQFIKVGTGSEACDIAVLLREAREGTALPGVTWLGGYRSEMTGTKAQAIDEWCAARGVAFLRHDYSGHGASGGAFADGSISRWLEESLAVFQGFREGSASARRLVHGRLDSAAHGPGTSKAGRAP